MLSPYRYLTRVDVLLIPVYVQTATFKHGTHPCFVSLSLSSLFVSLYLTVIRHEVNFVEDEEIQDRAWCEMMKLSAR